MTVAGLIDNRAILVVNPRPQSKSSFSGPANTSVLIPSRSTLMVGQSGSKQNDFQVGVRPASATCLRRDHSVECDDDQDDGEDWDGFHVVSHQAQCCEPW